MRASRDSKWLLFFIYIYKGSSPICRRFSSTARYIAVAVASLVSPNLIAPPVLLLLLPFRLVKVDLNII